MKIYCITPYQDTDTLSIVNVLETIGPDVFASGEISFRTCVKGAAFEEIPTDAVVVVIHIGLFKQTNDEHARECLRYFEAIGVKDLYVFRSPTKNVDVSALQFFCTSIAESIFKSKQPLRQRQKA